MLIKSTAKDMKTFWCEITNLSNTSDDWEADRDVIVKALNGSMGKKLTETMVGTAISVLLRKPKMDMFRGSLEKALVQYWSAVPSTGKAEVKALKEEKRQAQLGHLKSIKETHNDLPKASRGKLLANFGYHTISEVEAEIATLTVPIETETNQNTLKQMLSELVMAQPDKEAEFLSMPTEKIHAEYEKLTTKA